MWRRRAKLWRRRKGDLSVTVWGPPGIQTRCPREYLEILFLCQAVPTAGSSRSLSVSLSPPRPRSLSLSPDSLRVFLVDGAVHADGGAQPLHALVVLDAAQHRGQRGPAQAGRARGHDLADAQRGQAVLVRRLQAQLAQDLVGFLQPLLLPGSTKRGSCQGIQLSLCDGPGLVGDGPATDVERWAGTQETPWTLLTSQWQRQIWSQSGQW